MRTNSSIHQTNIYRFFLWCALLFFLPLLALADHSVRPLVVDLDMEPRAQAQETITITNQSDRMQRVYATVNAVKVEGEDTITEFTAPADSDNRITPTSWFQVSRARIEVPAGEQYELPVRVQIHPQAEPGVYHVLLGVAGGRNRPTAEERVRSGAAPGTLFRIEVADDRTAYLQLRSFYTDRLISNVAASSFSYTIENPSDTPLTPSGEIILYNRSGHEVGSVPTNPDQIEILPGSKHTFSPPISDTVGWGRHRAHLTVTYGDGQRASLTDTIFFYHVPLIWLSLIFFVLLLVSVVLSYALHRRYYGSLATDSVTSIPLRRRDTTTRSDSSSDVRLSNTDHGPSS